MSSVTFLQGIFEEKRPFGETTEFVLKSYGTGAQLDEKGREKLEVDKDTEIYLDIHLPASIVRKDEDNNLVVNLDASEKAKIVASPIPPLSQQMLAARFNAVIEPNVTVSRSLQDTEMKNLATLLNQERYKELASEEVTKGTLQPKKTKSRAKDNTKSL